MDTKQVDLIDKIGRLEESMTVRRVFGEPYEKDGMAVIPAARVQGGGGGGGGEGPNGEGGMGTGFGMSARPFGVFLIKDGDVVWRPAIDVNRAILGGQLVAIAALLLLRTVVKARAKVIKRELA
jgi:uncharacterized spore protein YtfJ